MPSILSRLLAACTPLLVAVAAALLPSAAPALPQAEEGPARAAPLVDCRVCDSTGLRDCPEHSRADLTLERATPYCSRVAGCRRCGGTTYTPCTACENRQAAAANDAHRERIARWMEGRREKVDEPLSGSFLHASSAHVDLTFDFKSMRVDNVRLDTHQLMHLYLDRIEEQRALFLDTLETTEAELPSRTEVFMWRDATHQSQAALRFAGMGARGVGVKLMGTHQIYSMLHVPRTMPDDEAIHRTLVHNLSHLFLANLNPQRWIGNLRSGWVDEGLAHYFEHLHSGRCTTYCHEEVATDGSVYRGGRYRPAVRRLVLSGRLSPFSAVSRKNTDQLSVEERALAFSYVDYLITESGGGAFRRFVTGLKQGKELRDMLQEVYELDVFSFERQWKEYVLRTYPVRESP